MGLETGTYIDSLVITNPASTDGLAQADDHIRLLKSTIASSFPGVSGAVTATHTELNALDGITSSTSELNVLDGITATTAELNFTGGVTSNIQTQLNAVAATAAAAIVPSGIISLWSGASNAIPTGYVLCDGTNNTPDLRNRFVIGAGSTYAVGATGGSANAIVVAHTHTGTTNTTGAHTHLIPHNFDSGTAGNYISGNDGPNNISGASNQSPMSSAGDHSHTLTTDSTGSSGTNANLPPYYALCYIMKT
jgi:hypothetical protein